MSRADAGLGMLLAALVAVLVLRAWPVPVRQGVLVEVVGDVARPGVHRLVRPDVGSAAAAAGTPLPGDTAVAGGSRLVVRGRRVQIHPAEDPLLFAKRVDVNAAAAPSLAVLPGVGPALAGRIEADRSRRGPFYDTSDLARVQGIGPATLARVGPLVTVGDVGPRPPPRRMDPNTADASAWERVRGIGPVTAAAIVADRDRNGPFESCAALARVHGVGPATVARVRAVAACPEGRP